MRVECFLTQPSVDGVTKIKTSLLGIDKYNDGPNSRSVIFLTQQFPFADAPAVIVHGEMLDENGVLAAADALAVLVVRTKKE